MFNTLQKNLRQQELEKFEDSQSERKHSAEYEKLKQQTEMLFQQQLRQQQPQAYIRPTLTTKK